MTRSASRGVGKSFSPGSLASARVDGAGDKKDVVAGPSPYPGGASFEWPPADEDLSGQIIEFAPEPVEGRRGSRDAIPVPESAVPASESETVAGVDAQGVLSGHNWHLPVHPREEDWDGPDDALPDDQPPQVVAAEKALKGRSVSVDWIRSHAVSAALVALAITAAAEGIFILRSLPSGSVSQAMISIPRAVPATKSPGPPTTAPRANHEPIGLRSRPIVRAADTAVAGGRLRKTRLARGASRAAVAPLAPSSRPPGWLGVTSPIEVDVFENGSLLGTGRMPQIVLTAGSHALEFVNEEAGFRFTRQVQIESEKVERIVLKLPLSLVRLNAVPWAEVWIDGKSVGETPIGNLWIAVGPHEIAFRHPELGEKTISTIVKAGVPTRLTANLSQSAIATR